MTCSKYIIGKNVKHFREDFKRSAMRVGGNRHAKKKKKFRTAFINQYLEDNSGPMPSQYSQSKTIFNLKFYTQPTN